MQFHSFEFLGVGRLLEGFSRGHGGGKRVIGGIGGGGKKLGRFLSTDGGFDLGLGFLEGEGARRVGFHKLHNVKCVACLKDVGNLAGFRD